MPDVVIYVDPKHCDILGAGPEIIGAGDRKVLICPAAPPFKIGDRVCARESPDIIRRVTAVDRDPNYLSGWKVSADGGGACCCCKRAVAPVLGANARHFTSAPKRRARRA